MHSIPGFSHLQHIDCLSIYSIISIETPSLQAWTKLILAVVVSQTKCIEDANSLLACCWFKNNDQQLQARIIIYKRIHELLMFPPKRKANDAQSPTISFFVPSNIEGMLQQMERRQRPWKNHKRWPPAARTSATVAPSVPPCGGELVCCCISCPLPGKGHGFGPPPKKKVLLCWILAFKSRFLACRPRFWGLCFWEVTSHTQQLLKIFRDNAVKSYCRRICLGLSLEVSAWGWKFLDLELRKPEVPMPFSG